jgi:hypothetical protein
MNLVTAAAFSARYSAGKTHNRLRLHDGNNNNSQHKNLSLSLSLSLPAHLQVADGGKLQMLGFESQLSSVPPPGVYSC